MTGSTIPDMQEALAAIAKLGCCVPAAACRNSCLVHPLPKARVRAILDRVDRYLSAVEAEGLTEFSAGRGQRSSSVFQILHDLQIVEGSILQMASPARIWVAVPSEQEGSIVKASDLQDAVEAEANKSDNKKKLVASGFTKRHLFVYVEPLNCGPWSALINGCIPEQPPLLPDEVTRVWAAAEVPGGHCRLVRRAARKMARFRRDSRPEAARRSGRQRAPGSRTFWNLPSRGRLTRSRFPTGRPRMS